MRTPLKTAVAVVFYIDAFMWLIGVVPTLYYAHVHNALPTMAGIRLMSGPFESLGIDALIVAGIIYGRYKRIEDHGRLLAMALQEGRCGSWANPVRA
jgi:hypothetical protein